MKVCKYGLLIVIGTLMQDIQAMSALKNKQDAIAELVKETAKTEEWQKTLTDAQKEEINTLLAECKKEADEKTAKNEFWDKSPAWWYQMGYQMYDKKENNWDKLLKSKESSPIAKANAAKKLLITAGFFLALSKSSWTNYGNSGQMKRFHDDYEDHARSFLYNNSYMTYPEIANLVKYGRELAEQYGELSQEQIKEIEKEAEAQIKSIADEAKQNNKNPWSYVIDLVTKQIGNILDSDVPNILAKKDKNFLEQISMLNEFSIGEQGTEEMWKKYRKKLAQKALAYPGRPAQITKDDSKNIEQLEKWAE